MTNKSSAANCYSTFNNTGFWNFQHNYNISYK